MCGVICDECEALQSGLEHRGEDGDLGTEGRGEGEGERGKRERGGGRGKGRGGRERGEGGGSTITLSSKKVKIAPPGYATHSIPPRSCDHHNTIM